MADDLTPAQFKTVQEMRAEILDSVHDCAEHYGKKDGSIRPITAAAFSLAIADLEADGLDGLSQLLLAGIHRATIGQATPESVAETTGLPRSEAEAMLEATRTAQAAADLIGERLKPYGGGPLQRVMGSFIITTLVEAAESLQPGFRLVVVMTLIGKMREAGHDAALLLDGKPYTGDATLDRPGDPGTRQ